MPDDLQYRGRGNLQALFLAPRIPTSPSGGADPFLVQDNNNNNDAVSELWTACPK
jgi:hypothetical protein